ncbi:hypothetical protein FOPE_04385 [Fonsecaea pedrosoi]|nr:hypothetical protein FOPE_04385 [Fonsecaea pedrosoi]
MTYNTKTLSVSDIWMPEQEKPEQPQAQEKKKVPRQRLVKDENPKQTPGHFFDTAEIATSINIAMADYLIKAKKQPQKAQSESFRLLLNHLDFVHHGFSFWVGQLKEKPEWIDFRAASARLEALEDKLEELKKKILEVEQEFALERPAWDLATVSAIVLILDMELQSLESAPNTLGEVESEILQRLVLGPCDEIPDRAGTGLPAIFAVCISGEQVIWGECKARWWPFSLVDSTFCEMRLGRLPNDGDKLRERTAQFQKAWGNAKGDTGRMKELMEEGSIVPFKHDEELRAYHLCFDGRMRTFTRCRPCLKCSYVYVWGGQEEVVHEGKFNRVKNCAEDDVHLRLQQQLGENVQDD